MAWPTDTYGMMPCELPSLLSGYISSSAPSECYQQLHQSTATPSWLFDLAVCCVTYVLLPYTGWAGFAMVLNVILAYLNT